MFVFEVSTWLALSFALVMLHFWMSPGHHRHPALTAATCLMWGATGGLLGTVIRLQSWDTSGYSVLSLGLAGVGSVAFLVLEWLGSEEHAATRRA